MYVFCQAGSDVKCQAGGVDIDLFSRWLVWCWLGCLVVWVLACRRGVICIC